MNNRSLLILVVVTAIAAALAYWVSSERAPDGTAGDADKNELVPGLGNAVNEVTTVKLIKGSEQPVATLVRGEHGWNIAEKDDYPANMSKVRELLLALEDAELREKKTAKAALYERLGVQDVSEADAPGVQVTLDGLSEPASVIIGNTAPGGTYVRRVDEQQSWLVNGSLTPGKETVDWLDPNLLDIPAERIQQVVIQHSDGQTLELIKESRDQPNFNVQNIPAERKLKSEGVADPLGGALSSLGLEDVKPVAALDPGEHSGTIAEFRTFDGVIIVAKAFTVDEARYVHFGVSSDPEQALRFAETAAEDTAETTDENISDEAEAQPDTDMGEVQSDTDMDLVQPDTDMDLVQPDTDMERPLEDSDETQSPQGSDDISPAEDTGQTQAPAGVDFDATQQQAERLDQRLKGWVFNIPTFKYDLLTERLEDLLEPLAAAEPDVPPLPEASDEPSSEADIPPPPEASDETSTGADIPPPPEASDETSTGDVMAPEAETTASPPEAAR